MAIYALGLPQVRSLAYLFSSVSIAADRTAATPVARLRHTFLGHHYGGRRISGSRASNDAPSTTVDEVSVSQEPDANTRAPLSGDHVADLIAPDRTRAISAALSRPYLLFGRMAGDGRLQAIWTRRHGPRVQTVLSGISSLSNDHPSQVTT